MKAVTVTLVHAPSTHYAKTQMFGIHYMPVWAYTLCAHIAAIPDVEFKLFDYRFENLRELQKSDIFALSGINQDLETIRYTHSFLKKKFPRSTFVLGGPICWSFQTAGKIEQLGDFDHFFVGDGEETFGRFLSDFQQGTEIPRIIEARERFNMETAREMNRALLDKTISRYYGAVLEVSRGCPFLCEFCDIRILPDNNRAHVKDPDLIVREFDHLVDMGVHQVLLASDNFIGDEPWAEAVCDKVIEWRQRTGKSLSLYTWLTVNVGKRPRLLRKLRLAGFDMFFIGVESFYQNSLLETAKVQNTVGDLQKTIREIQSYGFVVVAGLIFGFDSDPNNIVDITLTGIQESGLISGDPSLLTALPGTPLHRRMKLSGRLRNVRFGLGGYKYQTNILYLRPKNRIISDYQYFVKAFNNGRYQYERLMSLYSCLQSENYIAPQSEGYINLLQIFRLTIRNLRYIHQLFLRVYRLLRSPVRDYYILKALWKTANMSSRERPLWFYFKFWVFNWSNSIMKYSGIGARDFDIDSVSKNFSINEVLPRDYAATANERIPIVKISAQQRLTTKSLKTLIESSGSS